MVAADSVQSIAFGVAVALLFVVQSRATELIFLSMGSPAYLGKILFAAGLLMVALTGAWRRALSNRPAVLLLLLTGVFVLDVPFSVWKGGSANLLVELWVRVLAYFIILAGSLVTVSQCLSAMYAIGLSGIVIAAYSGLFAADFSQRLQLDAGSLGNPNDLAFALLMSIPCCILVVLRAKGAFVRTVGCLLAGLLVVSALQTGSRGGLIVLAAMLVFLFFTSRVAIRIIEVLAVVVLVAVSFAIAPENVFERYRIFVSGNVAESAEVSWEAGAAVGSSESRKELLRKSLIMTLQHPVFGVGPGMFAVVVADEHKAAGGDEVEAWRETHNSYTQMCSECGLPALALYLGILVYALRANFRMYRSFRHHKELADAGACAYCLFMALIAYAVNGMFMSTAYGFTLPMLAALTACLERASAASMRPLSPRPAV